MNIDYKSSSTSPPSNARPVISHKRKAGRKKFKETHHSVYRGVRRKKGDKWMCEVREPNKKTRIWLGTFASPETAARAHDVAALALHGKMARLNFPDSVDVLPRAKSASARDIQLAALDATRDFPPPTSFISPPSINYLHDTIQVPLSQYILSSMIISPDSDIEIPLTSCFQECKGHKLLTTENPTLCDRCLNNSIRRSLSGEIEWKENRLLQPNMVDSINVGSYKMNTEQCSSDSTCVDLSNKVFSDPSMMVFADEEAVFNMPGLLDSMAEGLLITPPSMKRGFNWGDMVGHGMDLTLWRD